MSDQIQETQQTEVQQTETVAPKKDNWFLKIWRNKNKRNIFMLACCLVLILFATMVGSLVQTDGWTASVEDLRGATNRGKKLLTATDGPATHANIEKEYDVNGYVASGLLYVPKNATAEHPAPAIVFTHGLYNNREMQLQNVIEMVRRGYVVLTIDYNMHGHNTDQGSFPAETFVKAAAYLYNLPYVDKAKIGVSGHSMGGGATTSALAYDGIDTPATLKEATLSVAGYTQTVTGEDGQEKKEPIMGKDNPYSYISYKNGYHMGIISAGLVQANNAPSKIGSNVIAAGVVKASADEFFFSSTLKEPTYVRVSKTSVNETNYTNYYLKKGDEYVKQTADDKYRPSKQYYSLTTRGDSTYYLQSQQAVTFTGRDSATLEDWTTINGGIYANGSLLAEPNGRKLVSRERKGEALANATTSIRAIYEARETHPMNHFSVKSASHVIDFFYNAFGTPEGARYISATSQSWWLKEVVSIFGFIGLFGILFPVLDILLNTRLFASLKAKEGEVTEGPVLLTRPRKHVSYWLGGILTAVFGAVSLKHSYYGFGIPRMGDPWELTKAIMPWMSDTTKFIYNDTVAGFAAWGIMCGLFALVVTIAIWGVNRCINIFKYGDLASNYDERPLDGFKIRSWQNVLKTPLLAGILLVIFYGIMFGIWGMATVDFRFWTFDLRVFDLIRIPAMLKYVPFFFIFYMITSALSKNYRVKDLPEWATIAINVVFNVIGIIIVLWASNDHFIRTGTQVVSYPINLFYIAAIPIIPCVGFATVIARRMYVRTGNAWLAGIINAVIMTFIACANTSIVAQPAWVLGA